MRPYLVFCSTASLSTCTPELFGPEREFDVCVHFYDPKRTVPLKGECEHWSSNPMTPSTDGIYLWHQEGEKLNVAAGVIPRIPAYQQYCFLDDDITVSTTDLNRLFRVGDALRLPLYQPALTNGSFGSHQPLFQYMNSENYPIRKVPFVEIMCPFFSAAALVECLSTFDLNESGWGLDCYLWPKIAHGNTFVVGSIPVGHYREPARRKRILRNGLTPAQELWTQSVIDDPAKGNFYPPDLGISGRDPHDLLP